MQFFNLNHTPAKEIVLRLEPRVFFLWNESHQIEFSLERSGAAAYIFALFIGHRSDSFDLSVIQHHKKPDTQSHLTVLSILDGQAKFSYSGLIRIAREAIRTDASQTNRNILLSEDARASSSPQLEILADDVSARHASATGTTQPESLFFLETRGIELPGARQLLAEGAVRSFFDHMRAYTDDAEVDALEQAAFQQLTLHLRS